MKERVGVKNKAQEISRGGFAALNNLSEEVWSHFEVYSQIGSE